MSIVIKHSNINIAPRKVRQVCDLIRNKKVEQALKILRFCEKKRISIVLTKLINSGLARASDSGEYVIENLIIKTIYANDGRTLKRIRPVSKGRAHRIRKRSGHIFVEMKEA